MENKSKEQNANAIKLNEPNMKRGKSLMEAFANRKSVRTFNSRPLSTQDLSDLLWAAKGVNRPKSGGLTSSNSLGKKEIDIYVCTPDGACLYCAEEHCLIPIIEVNLIPCLAAGQDYVYDASTVLLIVADMSVFTEEFELMGTSLSALDGGIVSQNIYLFCSGNGLDTIARGTMDGEALKSELKLKDSQILLLNHPVGYSNI